MTTSAPRKRMTRRKKLLAMGLGTLMGLFLVEVAARIVITEDSHRRDHEIGEVAFHEQISSPATDARFLEYYAKDDRLGFGLFANVSSSCVFREAPGGHYKLRTNALALRDERPLAEKHGKRILVLGDSMTFGIG